MARVIVILALMLAITAAMVAITRKSAITPGEAASEPSATVHLTEVPDTDKDQETESLKSTEPRTFSNTIQSAALASSTASAQDVAHGPVAGAAPAFGTAGIDHKGNASFTGTATPGDAISLMSDGKTVGTTTADAKGAWSLDLRAPKSKHEQELLVSAQGKDGTTVIGPQRAVIAPPAERGGLPRITLKAADQTVTATKETAAPAEPKTGLVVEKVASGDGDITLLSGKADPGATVKVAINGKPAGEAQVDDTGVWSIAASNPSGKAADSLRLELLDKTGATLDKTEVPYKVPAAATRVVAAAPVAKSDFPSVLTSKPSPRKKPSRKSHTASALLQSGAASTDVTTGTIIKVRRGDSLWRIARRHLGKGKKWAAFYKTNKEKIDNPDLIYPGQVLVIPG